VTAEPVRKRDSAATRAALLDAAAKLFAERGYDRTTVRDIAAEAGVNQALLFRYFGSKDALFASVMAGQGRAVLEEEPPERLPAAVLRLMLDNQRADNLLVALLRSATDEAGAEIRRGVGAEYARVLRTLTDADDSDLRAELVLAWLVGISVLRSASGKHSLANASAEEVIGLVLPAVTTLLERTEQ
jgi:AcrR family transcriptional regulator